MSALDDYQSELAAVETVASNLGRALLIAELSQRAGLVGATEYRALVGRVLGETPAVAANPPCGCHSRGGGGNTSSRYELGYYQRNPPIGASLRSIGTNAIKLARNTVVTTVRQLRRSPVLVIGLVGAFAAWDFLVPDEAVAIQQVITQGQVLSEQLSRLPPKEAAQYLADVGAVYGDTSSSSLTTWLVVGGLALVVGVPLVRRALA